MSEASESVERYEEIVKRLGAALRGARLYSPSHPRLRANAASLRFAAGIVVAASRG